MSKHSVYVDDYGDGFRYAFAILSLASQLSNTALLLEEPEVHQHTGALRLLFSALNTLAQRNQIQLFVSTHSLDLTNILLGFEDVRLFHCDATDSGDFVLRPLLSPDIKLVTDLGIDIRTIIKANRFLCVEGPHDKLFVQSVSNKLNRTEIESLGFQVIEAAKKEQKTVVSALATTGKPIMVLTDLDKDKAESIFQAFVGAISSKFSKSKYAIPNVQVIETGSNVEIFFVGLPADGTLSSIGIDSFAMEDYLLKLIDIDKDVKDWVGATLPELHKKSQSLRAEKNVRTSKTVLSTLGVMKDGLYLEDLIKTIIDKAHESSIRNVIGPLQSLFAT